VLDHVCGTQHGVSYRSSENRYIDRSDVRKYGDLSPRPKQLETIGRKSGWPVAMEVKTTPAEGWKGGGGEWKGEDRRWAGQVCCDCERCLRQQLAAIRLLTDWSCSCPCRPGCARRHSLSSGVGFCHGRPTDARNKAVTVLGSIYRQHPACVCVPPGGITRRPI